MKIINLDFYRRQREIENLEKKVGELVRQPHGVVGEIKTCFKEWLLKTGSR